MSSSFILDVEILNRIFSNTFYRFTENYTDTEIINLELLKIISTKI